MFAFSIENCTEGSIRLSNGANNLQGRVEVCVGNKWGTVCHNYWNNVDAQVVCKQLGHPNSGKINIIDCYFIRFSKQYQFPLMSILIMSTHKLFNVSKLLYIKKLIIKLSVYENVNMYNDGNQCYMQKYIL